VLATRSAPPAPRLGSTNSMLGGLLVANAVLGSTVVERANQLLSKGFRFNATLYLIQPINGVEYCGLVKNYQY